ncbi:hypothetical protein L1887_51057 [Cichorium endivia]|nr:hypothetical protein L1887_51057 [Cichorium endivia]
MVGAAAALSGVTRTTVSLAVIMFELTGTLTYSVPVMLSILVAKTIADALEHKGIYDLVIEFSGLPYLDSKTEYIWNGVNVTDAMETEVEVICLDAFNSLQSLADKLDRLAQGSGYTDGGFPIVSRVATATSSAMPASPLLSASLGSLTDAAAPSPGSDSAYQMVGYIAASELEHALTRAVRADAEMRPEVTRCSFNNIPFVRAENEGEANVRDSVLFTASDPLDLSRIPGVGRIEDAEMVQLDVLVHAKVEESCLGFFGRQPDDTLQAELLEEGKVELVRLTGPVEVFFNHAIVGRWHQHGVRHTRTGEPVTDAN